ncbi:MAG: nuclear transport factor 2 family protein [Candidatus Binatia bacterium]
MSGVCDPALSRGVEAFFKAIGAADVEGRLSLFSADAVVHDPVGSPPAEGPDAIRRLWLEIAGLFESLAVTQHETFYAGNGAAVKWVGRGRGVNGAEVEFEGIDVFEFNDHGYIQTLMSYWDPAKVVLDLAGENEDPGGAGVGG